MKRLLLTASLLAALLASAAETNETVRAQAERDRRLVERYSASIATVRYYLQRDADGETFRTDIPYKCPNCGETHWRLGEDSVEKGIPAEFAGFLIGPDRVILQDVAIPPEFIARIEVLCAGETLAASEDLRYPTHDALSLRTAKAFAAAKPLAFTGKEPKVPRYFYMVREGGLTVAGMKASHAPEFEYHVESGKIDYEGIPNTVVVDEKDAAVTVALQRRIDFGAENFSSPLTWTSTPAAARWTAQKAVEDRLRRSVLPLNLQLEARNEDGRYSGSGTDRDLLCFVLDGGRILVPVDLGPSMTARLGKLEATLPDGSKAELAFVGSLMDQEGFIARFKNEVKGVEPLSPDRRPAPGLYGERGIAVAVSNAGGGRLKFKLAEFRLKLFARTFGNETVALCDFGDVFNDHDYDRSENSTTFLAVNKRNELLMMAVGDRKSRRSSAADELLTGSELLAMVDHPVYDPENVPRPSDELKRTAWLGVEVQGAGREIVREKRATAYIDGEDERAALVTAVISNTPASKLGIAVGDLLLSARFVGSDDEQQLRMPYEYSSSFDWGEYFEEDGESDYGSGTPWPNVEAGINGRLTACFGVGAEVVVAWVSDGKRKDGQVRLEVAPVHFQNAPKSRNKDLGITVKDMTYEVRKYFKFDDSASGVVVLKIKSGGPAAVAGIRPLELITSVNGEEIHSAKEFGAKTRGKKELTFSVRRLNATRIVPIRMPD